MRNRFLLIPTLFALLSLSVVFAACGGVPGNAVAQVDGEPIRKTEFDQWMAVAAKAGGQAAESVPRPPEYRECIAEKRENQPEASEDSPEVTDEQLRQQCRQEYEAIRDRVMQLLVSSEWIEREAEQMDIELTEEQVRKAFEQQRDQQFPDEKDYREFLEQSGQTEEQLLEQVRTGELARLISEKVVEGTDQVSAEDIENYYKENRERFAQPETRDAHVILTETRAEARAAKQALEEGQSWRRVAERYSIDEASKQQGGALEGVTRGTQDAGLDEALFSAARGEITGPVRTPFGYYVFEVDRVTDASQQTLEEARDSIRQAIVEERRQKALDEFVKEYEEEWRGVTECREGYQVPALCDNAPEPEETPTPAPGAPSDSPGSATPPAQGD